MGAVVLAVGGMVLLRTPPTGAGLTHPLVGQHTPGTPAASSTFDAAPLHGLFALQGSRVLAGTDQAFFAEVRLWTDKATAGLPRAPLALAIVLDRSGSMQGQKIEEAKRAIVKLVTEMKDDDEVSFVEYSDGADTVQPLGRVGDVRSSLLAKVRSLSPGGGTNIAAGLRRGAATLTDAAAGHVRRVILVSDGLDQARTASEEVAREGNEHHVTTSAIGIGLDFDEAYMSSVARLGHGNFAFAKDGDDSLATFMRAELTEGASTLARDATVHVRLPAGFHFVAATGADAIDHGGGDVELRIGDLAAADDRRVLVEMRSTLGNGEDRAFTGQLQWSELRGAPAHLDLPRLDVVAVVDQAEIDGSENAEVLASAGSVLASRQELEAAEAYSHGDVARARSIAVAQQAATHSLGDKLTGMAGGAVAASPYAAPPAAAIQQQSESYKGTISTFESVAPASSAGRAAAKQAVVLDSKNLARPAAF